MIYDPSTVGETLPTRKLVLNDESGSDGSVDDLGILTSFQFVDSTYTTPAGGPYAQFITFYRGTNDQLPDPTIESYEGANAIPYRNTAYVVFHNLPLEKFGNRIPNLSFEIFPNCQLGPDPYGFGVSVADLVTDAPPSKAVNLFYFTTSDNSEGTRYVINYDGGAWSVDEAPAEIEYSPTLAIPDKADSWTGYGEDDVLVWDEDGSGLLFTKDGQLLFDMNAVSENWPVDLDSYFWVQGGAIFGGRVIIFLPWGGPDYESYLLSAPLDGSSGWQVLWSDDGSAGWSDRLRFNRSGTRATSPGYFDGYDYEGVITFDFSGSGEVISAEVVFEELLSSSSSSSTPISSSFTPGDQCQVFLDGGPYEACEYDTGETSLSGSTSSFYYFDIADFVQNDLVTLKYVYENTTAGNGTYDFQNCAGAIYDEDTWPYWATEMTFTAGDGVTYSEVTTAITYSLEGAGIEYSIDDGFRAETYHVTFENAILSPTVVGSWGGTFTYTKDNISSRTTRDITATYYRTPLVIYDKRVRVGNGVWDSDSYFYPNCVVTDTTVTFAWYGTSSVPVTKWSWPDYIFTSDVMTYVVNIEGQEALSLGYGVDLSQIAASAGGSILAFLLTPKSSGDALVLGYADGTLTDITSLMPDGANLSNLVPLRSSNEV